VVIADDHLEAGCAQAGLRLRLADSRFCTDNAAMIGILAERIGGRASLQRQEIVGPRQTRHRPDGGDSPPRG